MEAELGRLRPKPQQVLMDLSSSAVMRMEPQMHSR